MSVIKKYQQKNGALRFIEWFTAWNPFPGSTIEVSLSALDEELITLFGLNDQSTYPSGSWNGYIIQTRADFSVTTAPPVIPFQLSRKERSK